MNGLAPELIDDIIGHVDEKGDMSSRSQLLTCSLVCRLWLPSSQRRLFHHIKFRQRLVRQLHADIQRLDQVLLNSPHLANYIRVLELPDMSRYLPSTFSEPLIPGWIALDKLLSPLLHKVSQVQKLKISGLSWNALPGDFRQSLCRVLELPSMARIYISDARFICMDDFTNFINHARGLTSLSLNYINTSWVPEQPLESERGEDNNQRPEPHRISHLTRLDMMCRDNSVFVDWLLRPRSHFGVSHIHTLHIYLPEEDASVNRLLCAIGSSLKHVSIILPQVCE
jgi:hypothetical protein